MPHGSPWLRQVSKSRIFPWKKKTMKTFNTRWHRMRTLVQRIPTKLIHLPKSNSWLVKGAKVSKNGKKINFTPHMTWPHFLFYKWNLISTSHNSVPIPKSSFIHHFTPQNVWVIRRGGKWAGLVINGLGV